jgi:two-component sensor histidine kinase
MADLNERKAGTTRKSKKQPGVSSASTSQAKARARMQPKIAEDTVRSHLAKAIPELQGLQQLLLSSEVDSDVLEAFRDAVNRVRTAAWAAQQYVARKETDQGSDGVLSLLVGERIRNTYQLCRAISEDLKRTDIELQHGSIIQLHGVTKTLTEQLEGIIKRLG